MKAISSSFNFRPRYWNVASIAAERSSSSNGTQAPPLKMLIRGLNRRRDAAPHRRRLCGGRIARRDEQLKLVSFQPCCHLSLICRPPSKSPFRQTFLAQPKSLPVIDENLDR